LLSTAFAAPSPVVVVAAVSVIPIFPRSPAEALTVSLTLDPLHEHNIYCFIAENALLYLVFGFPFTVYSSILRKHVFLFALLRAYASSSLAVSFRLRAFPPLRALRALKRFQNEI